MDMINKRENSILYYAYLYPLFCSYVQACQQVLRIDALTLDQFSKELLPSLLTLSMDKIPNVRIAVAQLISQCLLPLGLFILSVFYTRYINVHVPNCH